MGLDQDTSSSDGDCDVMTIAATANLSIGHDNAADMRTHLSPAIERRSDLEALESIVAPSSGPFRPSTTGSSSSESNREHHRIHGPSSLVLAKLLPTSHLPISSPEPVPHSYQRALSNRFPEDRFRPDGDLQPHVLLPIFIHDVLMLPGSLANVMGKASAEDILHRLTPAQLGGARLHLRAETKQPVLLPSTNPDDSVHGLLLFGCGRRSRKRIDRHYQAHSHKVIARPMCETITTRSAARSDCRQEKRLIQSTIMAEIYLWSNDSVLLEPEPEGSRGWTLNDFLTGTYDADTVYYDYKDPEYWLHGLREEGAFELTGPATETAMHAEVEMGSDSEAEAEKAVAVSRVGCFVSVEDMCDESGGSSEN
ncbi:hypothetical protein LTR95_016039 [Oleoguttula sp. CCFEE 5521]